MSGPERPASGPGTSPVISPALAAAEAREEAALAALTALPADASPEVREAVLAALADAQEATLCAQEDHRLCRPQACQHAAEVWPAVLAAAGPRLAASGRRWAVVCAVPQCTREHDGPRVLLCTDTLTAATSARNSHYRTAHDGYERRGVPSVHAWVPLAEATPDGPIIA